MDIQNILVLIIVVFASTFVGINVWKKLKSFSPKNSSCGTNCGCDSKQNLK